MDSHLDDPDDLDDPPDVAARLTDEQATALRLPLLKHEAWLQSIGGVVLLGAVFVIGGPLLAVLAVVNGLGGGEAEARVGVSFIQVIFGLFLTGFGALCLRGGLGLGRLDPKHRMLYTALMSLWALTCSPLTPLGLWGLYLLHSSAGATVLSPKYTQIIARTPQLRAKRSVMNSIVIFLVLLALFDTLAAEL